MRELQLMLSLGRRREEMLAVAISSMLKCKY